MRKYIYFPKIMRCEIFCDPILNFQFLLWSQFAQKTFGVSKNFDFWSFLSQNTRQFLWSSWVFKIQINLLLFWKYFKPNIKLFKNSGIFYSCRPVLFKGRVAPHIIYPGALLLVREIGPPGGGVQYTEGVSLSFVFRNFSLERGLHYFVAQIVPGGSIFSVVFYLVLGWVWVHIEMA